MKIDNNAFFEELFSYYNFNLDKFIGYKTITKGHINTTYTLYFDYGNKVKRFLLQEINTNVFKNEKQLMNNISKITTYYEKELKKTNYKNYKNKVLRIYKTKDKKCYVTLKNKSVWRVYHYIENSCTFDISKNEKIFYESGKVIGKFHNILKNYNCNNLEETIKDFHNTPKRFEFFIESLNNCNKELLIKCKDEIDFFKQNTEVPFQIQHFIDKNIMPIRITHNDTKLNNIMFEYGSNKGLCLVDLDTIMPGCICFDYGDFIRSACSLANEDEKDLSKVIFQKDSCLQFTIGFLEKMKNISEIELSNLINGALTMIYECGMRFLTDYLNNNIYFKTDYESQNLDRCKTQIHLYKQVLLEKENLESKIIEIKKSLS